MVDGLLSLVPAAKVGHIGMYRDEETLKPVEYLVKLPEDIDQRRIFVVDPMLATGGSAILAIDSLKKRGASHIKFVWSWYQRQKGWKLFKKLTQMLISLQQLSMIIWMNMATLFLVLEMQVTVYSVPNKETIHYKSERCLRFDLFLTIGL